MPRTLRPLAIIAVAALGLVALPAGPAGAQVGTYPDEGAEWWPGFYDTNGPTWYEAPAAWGRQAGIVTGVPVPLRTVVNGDQVQNFRLPVRVLHFLPNQRLTRAQGATMLWRAVGSPAPVPCEGADVCTQDWRPFDDVARGGWADEGVRWAAAQGVTRGVAPRRFAPSRAMTRAEFAAMLWRAVGKPETETCQPEPGEFCAPGKPTFRDVRPGAFYADATNWALGAGVVGAGGGSFHPGRPITRAEAVTMLYRHFAPEPTLPAKGSWVGTPGGTVGLVPDPGPGEYLLGFDGRSFTASIGCNSMSGIVVPLEEPSRVALLVRRTTLIGCIGEVARNESFYRGWLRGPLTVTALEGPLGDTTYAIESDRGGSMTFEPAISPEGAD